MHRSRPGRVRGFAVCLVLALSAPVAAAPVAAPTAAPAKRSFADTARATAAATAEKVWHGAQDVAIFALGLIGVEYRWGGETPDDGLDCSGLVRYVFQQVTGVTLPRTAKEMARIGEKVQTADLRPGDLVFFNTRRFAFSHVGLYLGDNRFIHSPRSGSEVEIAQLTDAYWQKHFNGARRLVGVLPALVPTVISTAEATPSPAETTPSGE
jgi:cell wall-associated NlpC family hydrolase